MRISRTRSLRIDMGHYERLEFGASYTVDHNDLGYTDEDAAAMANEDGGRALFEELMEECERGLTQLLRQDVNDAAALTDEKKSFILARPDMHPREPSNRRKARR